MLGLHHFEVVLAHAQLIDTALLGVADAVAHGHLLQRIAEAEGAAVAGGLIALSGAAQAVAAAVALLQFAEYLLQRALTDQSFGLAGEGDPLPFRRHAEDAVFEEVLLEILEAVFRREQAVLLVHFLHPVQRFLHIAAGVGEDLQKNGQELFERRTVVLRGEVFFEA